MLTHPALTLLYSFSDNQDLEAALTYGEKCLKEYAFAQGVEAWQADGASRGTAVRCG
ncbi:hypothetical protein M2141_002862 [Lachnospiraceae bacterium PH5-48]